MSNLSKGSTFEQEVERILSLKGYKVKRNNLINGTQIDLHASRNDPLENVSLVVECADRDVAIGVDLVKEKSAILLSLQGSKTLYRLMFVARNGFTAEAKAFADAHPNISLLTLDALENLLVVMSGNSGGVRAYYRQSAHPVNWLRGTRAQLRTISRAGVAADYVDSQVLQLFEADATFAHIEFLLGFGVCIRLLLSAFH